MACGVCGQDYLRCNCVSQQPYCEQCSDNEGCSQQMDSLCVIYHSDDDDPPSKLTALGLPNKSNAQTIFEAIDAYLLAGETDNSAIDTATIDFSLSGLHNRVIQASVKVSPDSGNGIVARSNGLYSNYSGKVKINATDALDYLDAQIVGGAVDPYVQNSVLNDNGVLEVIPTINLNALRTGLGVQNVLIQDTQSVDLISNIVGDNKTLSANVKISATGGNTITINSDGLFSSGGGASLTFNNALTRTVDNIQLGGPLVQNTNIDHANTYQLSFTGTPRIRMGAVGTVPASTVLDVFTSSNIITSASSVYSEFTNIGSPIMVSNAFAKVSITSPTSTPANDFYAGQGGQLWIQNSATLTLNANEGNSYSGIYGAVIKSGSATVTGNCIAGGFFCGFAADTGNVQNMAAIKIGGVNDPPTSFGTTYTGTITNYFGIRIEDINASAFGGTVTNKYAIYQIGTSDISRFFGPVQNAGGTLQFTSDIRTKENINSFTRGLSEIEQIDTHKFNYTYNKDKQVVGILAQELEKIIPEAVQQGNFSTPTGEEFTDFRFVDQNVLFYTMLNAIKELSAKVKALGNN